MDLLACHFDVILLIAKFHEHYDHPVGGIKAGKDLDIKRHSILFSPLFYFAKFKQFLYIPKDEHIFPKIIVNSSTGRKGKPNYFPLANSTALQPHERNINRLPYPQYSMDT